MNTFDLSIVSAEKELFQGKVRVLVASGTEGELGIYPQHAPLLTLLKPGNLDIKDEKGDEQFFYVSGGILEVMFNRVIVLADSAERAKDLDEMRAQKAKEKAEQLLKDAKTDVEVASVQLELMHALAKLKVISRARRK